MVSPTHTSPEVEDFRRNFLNDLNGGNNVADHVAERPRRLGKTVAKLALAGATLVTATAAVNAYADSRTPEAPVAPSGPAAELDPIDPTNSFPEYRDVVEADRAKEQNQTPIADAPVQGS